MTSVVTPPAHERAPASVETWQVPFDPDGFRPRTTPGRHLRVVPRRRRSAAVPAVVSVGLVLAALFALAVMHAFLITGQFRLDELTADAASEAEVIRRLQLEVATLESPDRILEAARDRLGMVVPEEVGYLTPSGVASGQADVRVPAAKAPPIPDIDAGGSQTPATEDAATEPSTADGEGTSASTGIAGESGE